jgi:hypothetical protein
MKGQGGTTESCPQRLPANGDPLVTIQAVPMRQNVPQNRNLPLWKAI